ncbi:uncharacterized protein MICPUCDRAFT_38889 [Micromonas pusilla CCMP1545]|jgi:hypothetical protein|uniref:Predicted protein n=2 Tax=Micromonas pusilla TaxID=38833 RepID=C1MMG5_MICPC|nr:uncharacterized protein MICPUCDRAFT_38889 [Micromonas pusilla CCMP1545]EEH59046.1 predicted protein [Micromonas pusilla CCMP1545]|tara:strand:- start:192 stop:617 length:426 start_codon:yes stop_codon:yes gene_type:complete|eukprot:XP_003057401.1 predicted protein [Micromonas pusilla CCMP1545]
MLRVAPSPLSARPPARRHRGRARAVVAAKDAKTLAPVKPEGKVERVSLVPTDVPPARSAAVGIGGALVVSGIAALNIRHNKRAEAKERARRAEEAAAKRAREEEEEEAAKASAASASASADEDEDGAFVEEGVVFKRKVNA